MNSKYHYGDLCSLAEPVYNATMAGSFYNPFQAFEIRVPKGLHKHLDTYCKSAGGASTDHAPFPRMIDFWFLSVCLAARQGLERGSVGPTDESVKIIDGTIFTGDPWRITVLMLIAISATKDVEVVTQPRKVIDLANELAIAGIPRVVNMLETGESDPIWNLSEAVKGIFQQQLVNIKAQDLV